MNPILEIFSQGEEVVTGQIVDTNAAWLSERAVALGFTVARHTAVGDKLDDLIALLREIAQRADCCICTGGLGPTSDDLTAEAVAKAFGLPLEFDGIAFEQIQRFFARRNRVMPESNRKQAMFPKGAERIDNAWGTAPGFSLQAGRCWFSFVPGVPSEMRHLFLESIQPTLASRFLLRPGKLVSIKTLGIGESSIQQLIGGVEIPAQVQLGFRASPDDVQTKLLFPHDYPETAMTALVSEVAGQLGDHVFAIDGFGQAGGDLAFVIDRLMTGGKYTLAVVETVSQGLLAAKCVGADWLLEARYEQSVERLVQKLAVTVNADKFAGSELEQPTAGPKGEIQECISYDLPATAQAIAAEIQKTSAADFVLVQLNGGDNKTFRDKDRAIILYNTLLTGDGFHQTTHSVAGPINVKQNQAALLALDLLRRYLQHKEL
ncbi:molybdenum cofactor synthesis domain-containing protein/competence/damage-inducible protein CinA-like protein [Methylobacter tundripaludum]|uniref:Molybdenum cofactor synthesis domain-containing protein/competence/damage-inducible protein CinA-like protein n=1 Tax=Methylobacter tundripaludum TaxID=173365 RepID=A0A2S6H2Q2_9GAMM|nr:competence/damage-inducible protein A [Methylobacter tundripaludum]PPK71686.1 molybdenum cofactor synthesis domain-containing protein/competence/damage-inducible protein CinA-like protein [Methylobacter tundripaludum]